MLPVAARFISLDTRHTSRYRCVDVIAALAVLLALQGRNALRGATRERVVLQLDLLRVSIQVYSFSLRESQISVSRHFLWHVMMGAIPERIQ